MRKQIIKSLAIPNDVVLLGDLKTDGKFYVAVCAESNTPLYALVQEKNGFIFRSVCGQYGHSGLHATATETIQTAIHIGLSNQKIYQFDNLLEMSQFIANFRDN